MLRHQWCQGCCGVQVAVFCGGTGSMVSVVESVVVGGVGVVDDGLVVCEDVVVDECVVAGVGAPPPPPLARMARP